MSSGFLSPRPFQSTSCFHTAGCLQLVQAADQLVGICPSRVRLVLKPDGQSFRFIANLSCSTPPRSYPTLSLRVASFSSCSSVPDLTNSPAVSGAAPSVQLQGQPISPSLRWISLNSFLRTPNGLFEFLQRLRAEVGYSDYSLDYISHSSSGIQAR
ncbi:unnamed protein product [Protopolystoma xenopodis]|uniref:Uncharacterized protein n=1 Tax=Protopolystoma xenopodis TaxID=117903 RepID=A0A448WHP6_9PLAT|nr:unnamed protein product [Protopolystoma xenopodis]